MEGALLQVLKLLREMQTHVISHQVVKVAVLNCEPSKERMLLSFKLLSASEPKDESVKDSKKKGSAVNTGQLVDVKVLEKTDNPRSGCLLRRPPEPGPGGVRRRRTGGLTPARVPGRAAAAAAVLEAGEGERATLRRSQPWQW